MGRDRFLVVLPARYASTRFPGKPLAAIAGRPLIEWVYRRARQIRGAGELVVATDDQRIADVVRSFDGNVVVTSSDHATGTDRVAEVARSLGYDIVVNLQGDEPVFDPRIVEEMVACFHDSPQVDIVTACHPINSEDEFNNPNVVKVVLGDDGYAVYFSRSTVPSGAVVGGSTGPTQALAPALRHVGIYAYRKEALLRFSSTGPTKLERVERLEQLRALELGMKIRVLETKTVTIGVDVPDDVKKVEKELSRT